MSGQVEVRGKCQAPAAGCQAGDPPDTRRRRRLAHVLAPPHFTMSRTVLIAAAGIGSRLGDYTATVNKSLVRIGDKFAISLILEKFDAAITRFVVTIGYKGALVREFVELGAPARVCITTRPPARPARTRRLRSVPPPQLPVRSFAHWRAPRTGHPTTGVGTIGPAPPRMVAHCASRRPGPRPRSVPARCAPARAAPSCRGPERGSAPA